jgi:hypothetical protein
MPAHSSANAHTAAQRYPHCQRHHAAANGNLRYSTNSNGGTNTNPCCSRHSLSLPASGSSNRYPAGRLPGASHGCSNSHLALPSSHRRRTERAHRYTLSSAGQCGSHAGTHNSPGVPATRAGYSCANCPSGVPATRRRYADPGNPRSYQPHLAADTPRRANRAIRADTYPGSGAHSPASHRSAHV